MAKAPVSAPSACAHHWKIESPNGNPVLEGRCKRCGAEDLFYATRDASYDPLARENYGHRRAS